MQLCCGSASFWSGTGSGSWSGSGSGSGLWYNQKEADPDPQHWMQTPWSALGGIWEAFSWN